MQQKCHVYFQDEAPKVGAGWRVVIAKVGYKHVHLREPHAAQGTRISRKTWDTLRKDEEYEAHR